MDTTGPVPPVESITGVTLRPYATPLPLGFLALAVGVTAAPAKPVATVVMSVAAVRFAATGIYQLGATPSGDVR